MNRTPGSGPMSSPDGGQRPDVLPMFSQAGGRLAVLPMFSQADGRLDLLSMFSQAGDRLDLLSMFSQAGDRPDMLSMFSQAGDRRSSASGAGLRMFIPFELLPVLVEAEAAASRVAGRDLSPEECLWAFIAEIKGTYTEFEKRLDAKRRRALRRARYRCQAPGCRNRRGLHAHHIVFRSHGGSNADENFVVLCPAHHLRGVHGGRMRVRGPASDLVFEVGLRAGQPYMVFHGDVRVA